VNDNCVEFEMKRDLLIPFLEPEELHIQISMHYDVSIDIHLAFQRLLEEQEAPAIIIADLIASRADKNKPEE